MQLPYIPPPYKRHSDESTFSALKQVFSGRMGKEQRKREQRAQCVNSEFEGNRARLKAFNIAVLWGIVHSVNSTFYKKENLI